MKYNVNLFITGRVLHQDIEAENPFEAIAKAEQTEFSSRDIQDAEEHLSALADVVGDEGYLNSRSIEFYPSNYHGQTTEKYLNSILTILKNKKLTVEEIQEINNAEKHLETIRKDKELADKVDDYLMKKAEG